MKIANTYNLLTNNGTTSDIIKVVMGAYDCQADPQIVDLAESLRGATPLESCRNVWRFLIDNVTYAADRDVQEIKTPARLIVEGVGDCKSYSILTACVLRELGIPHFFRFVSYDERKEATHVYVVAVLNGKEIPIDVVAFVQSNIDFGNELKYIFRCDMSNRNTKIAYLAGIGLAPYRERRIFKAKSGDWIMEEKWEKEDFADYPSIRPRIDNWVIIDTAKTKKELEKGLAAHKRRHNVVGIGDTIEYDVAAFLNSDVFKIWTDGESPTGLTMAKGYLISEWEKWWTIYRLSFDRQLEAINNLVCLSDMIRAYNENHHSNEMLFRIGLAFNAMLSDGFYNYQTTDVENLPWFSDENKAVLLEYVSRDHTLVEDDDFMANWQENIIENNRIYTDNNGAAMSISGVENLRNDVTKTGGFYIYTNVSESKANRLGLKVASKRKIQMAQRSLDHQFIKSLSSAEIDNLHYKGCSETFGASPADVLSGKVKVSGIGFEPVTIGAVLMAIIGLITSIFSYLDSKNKALTEAELRAGVFDPNDIPNSGSGSGSGSGDGSGGGTQMGFGGGGALPWILGGLAISSIFLFRKKKGKGKKTNTKKVDG